jgi:dTDP-4-dehydrorhamnose reductase
MHVTPSATGKQLRVFVTGAAGQLGSAIVSRFADCDLVCPSRASLDIADSAALRQAVVTTMPDLIVNCAAYNDVDGAEDRPQDALAINAFAVRTLARAAEACAATVIHYSTDFVFDGTASTPYDEAATPAPRSAYAASKLLGEWFALEAPTAYVLRVESLFGVSRAFAGRRGSMETIVRGLEEGREIPVFTDRIISPSYVVDIAAATRYLAETQAPSGLYHCVNAGVTRWVDVAEELARVLGVSPNLRLISSDQLTLKASRPVYSALSTAKLAAAGFAMPDWRDAVGRWLAERNVAIANRAADTLPGGSGGTRPTAGGSAEPALLSGRSSGARPTNGED